MMLLPCIALSIINPPELTLHHGSPGPDESREVGLDLFLKIY